MLISVAHAPAPYEVECGRLMLLAQHKKPGGQQEGEHGVVHHVQGEQYQRKI